MWLALTSLYMSGVIWDIKEEELGLGRYYEKWMWMKEGVKPGTMFSRHIVSLMYIKDPIIGAFLVFFHDIPYLQIGSIAGTNVLCTVLFAWQMPYLERLDNVVEIVNYFLFSLTTIFFLGLSIPSLSLSERDKYERIGWIIMAILTVQLTFNFCLVLMQLWMKCVGLWRWVIEKCNKKKADALEARKALKAMEAEDGKPLALEYVPKNSMADKMKAFDAKARALVAVEEGLDGPDEYLPSEPDQLHFKKKKQKKYGKQLTRKSRSQDLKDRKSEIWFDADAVEQPEIQEMSLKDQLRTKLGMFTKDKNDPDRFERDYSSLDSRYAKPLPQTEINQLKKKEAIDKIIKLPPSLAYAKLNPKRKYMHAADPDEDNNIAPDKKILYDDKILDLQEIEATLNTSNIDLLRSQAFPKEITSEGLLKKAYEEKDWHEVGKLRKVIDGEDKYLEDIKNVDYYAGPEDSEEEELPKPRVKFTKGKNSKAKGKNGRGSILKVKKPFDKAEKGLADDVKKTNKEFDKILQKMRGEMPELQEEEFKEIKTSKSPKKKPKQAQIADEESFEWSDPSSAEQKKLDKAAKKSENVKIQKAIENSLFVNLNYGKLSVEEALSRDIGHEIVYGFGPDRKPRAVTDLKTEARMRVMARAMQALEWKKQDAKPGTLRRKDLEKD